MLFHQNHLRRRCFFRFNDSNNYRITYKYGPGHRVGSVKSFGTILASTVGYEKMFNWALMHTSEKEFVSEMLEEQLKPPGYFAVIKHMNKEGPKLLSSLVDPRRLETAPETMKLLLEKNATIVDVRPPSLFAG